MVQTYSGIDCTLRQRNVKVSDAEIKNLPVAGVIVIPSPGLGRAIYLHEVVMRSHLQPASAYVGVDADGDFSFDWPEGFQAGVIDLANISADSAAKLTDFLTDSRVVTLRGNEPVSTDWQTPIPLLFNAFEHANEPIVLNYDPHPSSALTGGHIANFISIRMRYWIMKVP